MNSLRIQLFLVAIALIAAQKPAIADQPGHFESVFQLVRTNLVGIDAERFDRDALRSLLRRMDGKVELLRPGRDKKIASGLVEKARLFEDRYGYLRVRQVEAGLTESLRKGLEEIGSVANLRGLMVDLRFASGGDYEAAVKTVNQFVNRDMTQLVVGERQLRTVLNANVIPGPIAILVNAETVGAAEALAGMMRRNDVGLLIGSTTGGATKVFTQFALKDGSQLRVATGEVLLNDGTPISSDGIRPDIEVKVGEEAERRFFGDAFALPKGRKQRKELLNEAKLVRQLELKLNPSLDLNEPAAQKDRREVFDPVLGRALDLLKGLNLLGPQK